MCVHTCVQARVRRLDANQSSPSIRDRHAFKAQGSNNKVSVLASLFPTLKITPLPPSRQEELFNYKYQGRSRLRPTPSPRALCQAKPKISLLCGGVGKPQPNNETRERCHGTPGAHGAGPARAGRQRGVLFTSSAPSERGLGARARAYTHTHTHTPACLCRNPSHDPQPA